MNALPLSTSPQRMGRGSVGKTEHNFGANLKACLFYLDMSQNELANKTGLTRAAISQLCAGKRDPTLTTVIRILKVLPIKFEKLAGIK